MMQESDLPCSDCDATLVEQTIHVRNVPVITADEGHVTLAECPRCGARYYPERTLSRLADATTESSLQGGN